MVDGGRRSWWVAWRSGRRGDGFWFWFLWMEWCVLVYDCIILPPQFTCTVTGLTDTSDDDPAAVRVRNNTMACLRTDRSHGSPRPRIPVLYPGDRHHPPRLDDSRVHRIRSLAHRPSRTLLDPPGLAIGRLAVPQISPDSCRHPAIVVDLVEQSWDLERSHPPSGSGPHGEAQGPEEDEYL